MPAERLPGGRAPDLSSSDASDAAVLGAAAMEHAKDALTLIPDADQAAQWVARHTAELFAAAAVTVELRPAGTARPSATRFDSGPSSLAPSGPSISLPLRARQRELGALRLVRRPDAAPLVGPGATRLSDWARHVALVLDGLLLAELERAASAQLEQVDFRLQELVARVGHDLRAPLGAVLMWIHVARGAAEPERSTALEAIEAGAREQNTLIGELVDLTRARVGRLALQPRLVRLTDLVEEAVRATASQSEKRGVEIDRPPPSSPPYVLGDPGRLMRSIANLLAHAIRTSSFGRRITLVYVPEPGHVRLELRGAFGQDDRPHLETLLSAFSLAGFQAERDATALVFGLSFAREMVLLHGGTLEVTGGGESKTPVAVVLRLPGAPAPALALASTSE